MKETPCFLPGKDPATCWGPDLSRGGSQKASKSNGILSSAAQGVNSAFGIVFFKIRTKKKNLFNESRIGSEESWQKNLNQSVNSSLVDIMYYHIYLDEWMDGGK